MNGYFQLNINEMGTFLDIFKENEGGEPVNINEVAEYLIKKGIAFDIASINREIMKISTKGSIKLDDVNRYPEREMVSVVISQDKLTAVARFYPPSNKGNFLTKEDIISDLAILNVKYGIDEAAIDKYMQNRQYCTNIEVAHAKPVIQGTDAYIEYFFNTDLRAKPQLNEDGSVDFFNLNAVNHINEGDLLARLTKETLGEPGIDVTNTPIKPRDVKRLMLKFGHNVRLSEDGLEAYSMVNGHVNLIDNQIFVSNVFEVENVDASTGNIDYNGSVKVNGNINSNFVVRAKGNIEIKGVVEGAMVFADGNIVMASGINGMGKGVVQAGGNIITKYIENANVISGGCIRAEAIMHSKVSARDQVVVDGRKGNIAGSYVSAKNLVEVKTLGSPYGSDTVIQLGIDPTMKAKMESLNADIENTNKQLAQIMPVYDAFKQKISKGVSLSEEQKKTFITVSQAAKQLLEKREEALIDLDSLKDSMIMDSNSQAIVRDVVYSGTKICINELQMTLKSDYKYCKFYKDRGDIKSTSL